MLTITIPDLELFDEDTSTFSTIKGQTIALEHSLGSISKWEAKWKEPYLSDKPKTVAQSIDYVRCMTITQNVNPLLYKNLSNEMMQKIQEYINDPMTATWINKSGKPQNKLSGPQSPSRNKRVVTSELVYYWMFESGIPMECQRWHFNRLMTLIEVCSEERKAADPNNKKKMSPRDIARSRSALNAQRKAHMHTRG